MPIVQMSVRTAMTPVPDSHRGIIFFLEPGNLLNNHLPEYTQTRKKRYTTIPLGATVIKLLAFVIIPIKNSNKTTTQKKICLMALWLNNLLIVSCNIFIPVNILQLDY